MTEQTLSLTPPACPLPANACDAHAHIFGPYAQFPLGEARSYTPPEAPFEAHQEMLDTLGFARGIFIQPSAYGDDPTCILDAVARAPDHRRAVGVAGPGTPTATLIDYAARGMAGLRFVELISARYAGRPKGASGFAELMELAPAMREAGLQPHLFAKTETFVEWMPQLLTLGIPLVIDHMAAAGPSDIRANDPRLDAILAPLREGRLWMKLTVVRRSTQGPDYGDARPFHDAFVAANSDRMLWGSDWPLVNLADPPNIGQLINLFDSWTSDSAIRHKVFVSNPAACFGFRTD
ncbi:amidohydrolase family protein [Pacificimonas sp. ICDLI1SI03]